MNDTVVAVIGAGSWGTTLANLLAKKGYPVRSGHSRKAVAAAINEHTQNPLLPARASRYHERLRATTA